MRSLTDAERQHADSQAYAQHTRVETIVGGSSLEGTGDTISVEDYRAAELRLVGRFGVQYSEEFLAWLLRSDVNRATLTS